MSNQGKIVSAMSLENSFSLATDKEEELDLMEEVEKDTDIDDNDEEVESEEW